MSIGPEGIKPIDLGIIQQESFPTGTGSEGDFQASPATEDCGGSCYSCPGDTGCQGCQ